MEKILIPRRTGEERKRNHRFSIHKRIKKYIKDGGKGNLNLMDSPIEKLPDNLKVGGSLYLYNTQIKEIPNNLEVVGNLDLMDSYIEKLPDNLKVGGYLDLENTPLSKKYKRKQIKDLIEQKGGYVKNKIFTKSYHKI